jgi:hypothetical protein
MSKVGDIRPSQLIHTFGIGALLDLPKFSAMVLGLRDWDTRICREIIEERLLTGLQKRLGGQLKHFYHPPVVFEEDEIPGAFPVGIPVAAFPRWMRCTMCGTLATVDSGILPFREDRRRPDNSRFVHGACLKGNQPLAIPVRFLVACREGHLSDFPWIGYVHNGPVCHEPRLEMFEIGATGDASDIWVRCTTCKKSNNMATAFEKDGFNFICTGHHPHLREIQEGCEEQAKPILLGASNSWFGQTLSALSIPRSSDRLAVLITERWADLGDVDSLEACRYATNPRRMPAFLDFTAEEIWAAICAKRQKLSQPAEPEPDDLRRVEWEVFTGTSAPPATKDFEMRILPPPTGFEKWFERTVLIDRLREVRALFGFTRIESNSDFADVIPPNDDRHTPLVKGGRPDWLPAVEVRGEGIFLQFREDAIAAWEQSAAVKALDRKFFSAHQDWRRRLGLDDIAKGYHGVRYVVLHSLAHALMRQIVLDCGYSAASIRERLYCAVPGEDDSPMAGILIYTAASDSEGTLGGLVHLGDPATLGRNLTQALESQTLCASDPLCSEHLPDNRTLHGACCHACLFAPETSCERANRYLDRAVIATTFATEDVNFFAE